MPKLLVNKISIFNTFRISVYHLLFPLFDMRWIRCIQSLTSLIHPKPMSGVPDPNIKLLTLHMELIHHSRPKSPFIFPSSHTKLFHHTQLHMSPLTTSANISQALIITLILSIYLICILPLLHEPVTILYTYPLHNNSSFTVIMLLHLKNEGCQFIYYKTNLLEWNFESLTHKYLSKNRK